MQPFGRGLFVQCSPKSKEHFEKKIDAGAHGEPQNLRDPSKMWAQARCVPMYKERETPQMWAVLRLLFIVGKQSLSARYGKDGFGPRWLFFVSLSGLPSGMDGFVKILNCIHPPQGIQLDLSYEVRVF